MERLFMPPTPLMRRFHRALCAEFIGTYFLVLTITMASVGAGALAPLAIGFALVTQVFSYGYVSGGMFNPSVSAGVSLVRLKRGEGARHIFNGFILYALVQCLGGMCGAMTGWFIAPREVTRTAFPAPAPDQTDSLGLGRTFVAELVFTFMLVSSVLNCAVSKKYGHAGNHFYGMVIGTSVMVGAFCVGSVSGGSFNPAVTLSLQVVQVMAMSEAPPGKSRTQSIKWIWLYWIAELLASYIAAFVFSAVSCEEYNDDGTEPSKEVNVIESKTEASLLRR